MWGNSWNKATQSWKADVLLLLNTTWGLDKKSGIWRKTGKIYLLGNPSPRTWNNKSPC